MSRPQIPTPDIVEEKAHSFDQSGAGVSDRSLTQLFAAFPHNHEYEHVLMKAICLNTLYYTNIKAIFHVANHIWKCNIDEALATETPDVVNMIALTPMKSGKPRWNYSFATKYCSWHAPDAYPIYDSYVDKLIWVYQKHDRFSKGFKRYELFNDYRKYKRILEEFQVFYGLTKFSFKQLDKFLWGYGKEYFA